jgi:hypothetical protein
MREQVLVNRYAVAISAFVLLAITSQSLRSESGMQSDIQNDFAAAVSRVASLRETNRSTAIVVTDQFKQIEDKHSLSEFKDFVASRQKLIRFKDAIGNGEFTDIDANSLRKIDRRFFPQDKRRIGFRYDADWKNIVDLHVTLLNDGGI